MKIALGIKLRNEPYGGSNQFGKALSEFLVANGVEVVYELKNKDIDIILIIDPRQQSEARPFSLSDVVRYVKCINREAILVHRVNECDERKGTRTTNRQLALANSMMDCTVYISYWLAGLFKSRKYKFTKEFIIIQNGADQRFFSYKKRQLGRGEKIKIVTHHWSPHKMKGWDIYSFLDRLLERQEYNSRMEFHYIGNSPKYIKSKNIIFHKPCIGNDLVNLIRQNHIYLTASINEPAGMHHIEGALCGLPLLYRNSGALPEYCGGYGVMFNGISDFEEKLEEIIRDYGRYSSKISEYNLTSDRMCSGYLNFFKNILDKKEQILAARNKDRFNLPNLLKIKSLFLYYKILNRLRFY